MLRTNLYDNTHKFQDSKSHHGAYLLYNGAPNPDDDLADYKPRIKAVRLA